MKVLLFALVVLFTAMIVAPRLLDRADGYMAGFADVSRAVAFVWIVGMAQLMDRVREELMVVSRARVSGLAGQVRSLRARLARSRDGAAAAAAAAAPGGRPADAQPRQGRPPGGTVALSPPPLTQ